MDDQHDAVVLAHPFEGTSAMGLEDGGMSDGSGVHEILAALQGLGVPELSGKLPPGCRRMRSARSTKLRLRRRSPSWAVPKCSWPHVRSVVRTVIGCDPR